MGPRVMERMNRHTHRIEWHKDIPGKSVGQDLFVKNAGGKRKERKKATVAILEAKYNAR